jgi:hypothetical protein
MKFPELKPIPALCLALAWNASAATRFVDLNSLSPTPPYTSWATAATNIQVAIDAAGTGDLILVTNGNYQSGGALTEYGSVTNRVALRKPVTVRSVNGPTVTLILGQQQGVAIRCAYVTNGAVLTGFTLTNGAARSTSSEPQY